jgi:very-short-patch-repair endonuclease
MIALQQAGVVTRAQVRAAGLSDGALRYQVLSGRWQRVYPAIYATFFGRLPRESRWWAAVLYGGDSAVLSHQTAAAAAGLIGGPPPGCGPGASNSAPSGSRASSDPGDEPVIHITVPKTRKVRPQPGLRIHRSERVELAKHPTRLPPQTRVEETILDLTQGERSLERVFGWLTSGCGRRLTTPARLRSVLAQRQRLRWRDELTHALSDVALGCHSPLELRYLRQVERAHALPTGSRQSRGDQNGRRLCRDVHYRQWRTIVELDGRVAHPVENRWRDLHRDNAAVAEGDRVLRYGWRDVLRNACHVAGQVAATLQRAGWPGAPRACGPVCQIQEVLNPPD